MRLSRQRSRLTPLCVFVLELTGTGVELYNRPRNQSQGLSTDPHHFSVNVACLAFSEAHLFVAKEVYLENHSRDLGDQGPRSGVAGDVWLAIHLCQKESDAGFWSFVDCHGRETVHSSLIWATHLLSASAWIVGSDSSACPLHHSFSAPRPFPRPRVLDSHVPLGLNSRFDLNAHPKQGFY